MYLPTRKDSGISLEQEMKEFKKEEPHKSSRKLPALSHIITTELWNTSSLPSPPTPPQHVSFYTNKSPIKLPGLSTIIDPNHHNQYQQKQLAPIHAYHPVRFDPKPLSPPLSASPSSPYQTSVTKTTKRTRSSNNLHPSQFICEHIIDTITGKTCCQAFRRSYDLSRHQTIHLKNRPLCYCHDCGKKFTRLDALRRHERIQGHNNK